MYKTVIADIPYIKGGWLCIMASNKFPKSVSFNLKNATDQAILQYVRKRNFSGYVKKLILADMAQKGATVEIINEDKPLSKFDRLQEELNNRANDVGENS